MSEEAQESMNRSFKSTRKSFARQNARINNLEDTFKKLLISSDPYLSSTRITPKKTLKSFSPDTLTLLLSPNISACNVDDTEM